MTKTIETINETTRWQDLTEGLKVFEPATSKDFMTGEWRTKTPVLDETKCTNCLMCIPYCPDSCITATGGMRNPFDLDHCKGCGICASACPFQAITMKEGR